MAEDDGVGRRGNWQHEGVAAAHRAGQHQVDGIEAQRQGHLEIITLKKDYFHSRPYGCICNVLPHRFII